MEAIVAPSSPTSTDSAPTPSAPVSIGTPAPSAPPAEVKRPSSFKAALEQAAKRTAVAETPNAPTPETAAIPPGAPETMAVPPTAPKPNGPIPFDVHTKALENARTKAASDAVAQYRQKVGWVEEFPQLTRDVVSEWIPTARAMHEDPVRWTLEQWIPRLQADARFGPQLQSLGGRLLSGRAEPMPGPDVEIVDQTGAVTGRTYSAQQLAARDEWRERQLLAKIGQELAPIKAREAKAKADADSKEQHERWAKQTDVLMTRATKILDGRMDLFQHIKAILDQHPTADPVDVALHVREQFIVPNQKATAQSDAVAEMQRKAAGNTASGASAAGTPKPRPKNPAELAAFMREMTR
jgi:hypothetical protein